MPIEQIRCLSRFEKCNEKKNRIVTGKIHIDMGCQHAGSDGTCVSLTHPRCLPQASADVSFPSATPSRLSADGQYTACSFLVGLSWIVTEAPYDSSSPFLLQNTDKMVERHHDYDALDGVPRSCRVRSKK